jgi:hypothetical protein
LGNGQEDLTRLKPPFEEKRKLKAEHLRPANREDRGLNMKVRVVDGQDGPADFCFLMSARKEVVCRFDYFDVPHVGRLSWQRDSSYCIFHGFVEQRLSREV